MAPDGKLLAQAAAHDLLGALDRGAAYGELLEAALVAHEAAQEQR